MHFSKKTLHVGGKIKVPDSFSNSKEEGEIVGLTPAGINVVYNKGTQRQQLVFYGYPWLNHMYGTGGEDEAETCNESGLPVKNFLNDKIPF